MFSDVEEEAIFKRAPKKCPVCKEKDFTFLGALAKLQVVDRDLHAVDRALPLVAIICKSCGHVLLFEASLVGLLPRDSTESTP